MYQEISAVAEIFRLADFCEKFETVHSFGSAQGL